MCRGETGIVATDNVTIEKALLGCVLLDALRVLQLCISAGLVPEGFVCEQHQVIYAACLWIHAKQRPVDVLTVADALRARPSRHGGDNQLQDIGGTEYLDELIDTTATVAHAEYYLKQVSATWTARQIRAANHAAEESLCNPDIEIHDVLARQIQRLVDIHASNKNMKSQKNDDEVITEIVADARKAHNGVVPGLPGA